MTEQTKSPPYIVILAGVIGGLMLGVLLGALATGAMPGARQSPPLAQATTVVAQPVSAPDVKPHDPEVLAAAMQKGGCGACHVIPGVANANGTIGPDLAQIGDAAKTRIQDAAYIGKATTAIEYLREAIVEPDAFVSQACPGGTCQKGLMPASLAAALSAEELDAIVQYLAGLPGAEHMVAAATAAEAAPAEAVPASAGVGPDLTDEEFAEAKQIFFDRCAGCHGTLRKGATGPALTPDVTIPKGTAALSAIIFNGTPRGMPDWGKQGVLTQAQAELMAKFVQNAPPSPPEMSLPEMQESWKVIVPVADRPTSPEHDRNWENYMAVTLRDAGQVAIIDGDTFEVVNTVNTGYAVHISRMSATGRYVYVIGRDGKASLVDTWMEVPEVVAEVKVCHDARSIEVSKYVGEEGDFSDKYAVVGCYWPPHFVILDGLTLEPFKIVSTRSYTYDTEEYHPEPRVAAIVASHFKPEWIINVKETGQVWLVNYTDPIAPQIKMIESERFPRRGLDASAHFWSGQPGEQDRRGGRAGG
jgi:nitrite reductase (NO-forming)/hydroxylamine reductase